MRIETLRDAAEYYRRVQAEEIERLYRRGQTRDVILYLRGIPAEDMRKKEVLAGFFRSEKGARFSKEERKQAYDDLLGQQTNKELRG